MGKNNRLHGQGSIIFSASSQTVGTLLAALISVGIIRITTHQLGPANYGLFALIITYVNLFSLVADLGITALTTRELARNGADRSAVLGTAISSRIAFSIVVIPIIIVSADLIYPGHDSQFRWAMAIMSLDVLFNSVQATAATPFAAKVRGDLLAAFGMANLLLVGMGVITVALLHGSYLAYVYVYVFADMIMAFVELFAARRIIRFRWTFDPRAWRHALSLAVPLGAIQLIDNVYSWIDTILVSVLRTSTELGYYSVAFKAVYVFGAVPGFLMQALIPSLVNATNEESTRLVNRALYVLFCIGVPLAVGGIVLRTDIILVLGGPHFLPAATPFAILAVTLPVSYLQTVFGYTSVTIDRYRPLLVVGLGTLIINIGLNLLMIPKFGPTGAASTLLASELISLIATYSVFRHLSGVRVSWPLLWRPALAAVPVLLLAVVRGPTWSHMNHLVGLMIGGALVTVVYGLGLLMIGGIPEELRPTPHGLHARRSRHWQ